VGRSDGGLEARRQQCTHAPARAATGHARYAPTGAARAVGHEIDAVRRKRAAAREQGGSPSLAVAAGAGRTGTARRRAGGTASAANGRNVPSHAAELDNTVYIAGPQAARTARLDEAAKGVSPAAAIASAPGTASAAKRRRGQRDAVDA